MVQSNLIAITFGTAEVQCLNWALLTSLNKSKKLSTKDQNVLPLETAGKSSCDRCLPIVVFCLPTCL